MMIYSQVNYDFRYWFQYREPLQTNKTANTWYIDLNIWRIYFSIDSYEIINSINTIY